MIALDKQKHLIAGAFIGFILAGFGAFLWDATAGFLFGAIVSAVVGAAKELFDEEFGGTVDVWDFVATASGGVAGSAAGALLVWGVL